MMARSSLALALVACLPVCTPFHAGHCLRTRVQAPLRAAGPIVCRGGKNAEWARPLPEDEPIRAGSVLLSTEGSVDHYFHEALVLVIEHSADVGTRGVLLNSITPWTVADMGASLGALDSNTVFLGGDAGRDTMVCTLAAPCHTRRRELPPRATPHVPPPCDR